MALKNRLSERTTSLSARMFFKNFEAFNQNNLRLVYRLLEELVNRQATLQEYWESYRECGLSSAKGILCYLDFRRMRDREQAEAGVRGFNARQVPENPANWRRWPWLLLCALLRALIGCPPPRSENRSI